MTGRAAGGGDNGETCLQRLMADMQLLQSKLHQFNTHSSVVDQNLWSDARRENTRSVPLSDNVDAKIDQLQQHYDAEVLCLLITVGDLTPLVA